MLMPRILAFIENDMYVRNFITSGAFDLLLQEPEFHLCLSEIAIKLHDSIPANKTPSRYARCRDNMALVYQFNKISMLALRDKSTTFDIKVKAKWMGDYTIDDALLSSTKDFNITKEFFTRKLQNNASLEAIITKQQPQLVIFPVTGVEATGTELIALSKKYGFKTLFLINGWDNLSSKGAFPLLPDYMGVWGPQSLIDAVTIHGMPEHRLLLMGCARYEDYFKPENAQEKLFAHKYVLFAGSTAPCDEITPLRLLDEAIETSGDYDIKVVYRPHPWREKRNCFDLFEAEKFKHVILDPQIADDYYGEKRKGTESVSSQNFPKLKYYPSLVNHAQFVISPMSSMTLEAALFDVPSIVLAHDDGFHPIPPQSIAHFRHFQGADEIPGWFFVRDIKTLKALFQTLLKQFSGESPTNRMFHQILSPAVGKYLFHDGRSYAQRLYNAVTFILASINSSVN